MGEAAKKIPFEIREKYPNIPWTEMAGMRDKLIHEYFGINLEIVYKTANEILPGIQEEYSVVMKEFIPE